MEKTKLLKLNDFNTATNSLKYHLKTILNFFIKRHTNANTESFKSKIKLFRANQKGVLDVKFFLFKMEKNFA
ncbi:transposase [Flavobacterium muglaense]|uniref:transposase n=1 Tax=Flavobacterium muglaense TaxID=2764716 RepID=UPI00293BA76E|nr:transposase [Flavobacterium muglaense]